MLITFNFVRYNCDSYGDEILVCDINGVMIIMMVFKKVLMRVTITSVVAIYCSDVFQI